MAVTGVTGYVGGRLVPELLAAGYRVRAIARHPDRLRGRPWYGDVEVVAADAAEPEQIRAALDGTRRRVLPDPLPRLRPELRVDATGTPRSTFAQAAREAGVGRIVYLGGLYPEGEDLSPHLASRTEVGEILLASGVPTTVLRAAVILGSGSASFEMMRYLTERLPAMTVPRWVDNRIQPIAVRDVLRYLVGSAAMPPDVNRGFDIGGPDVLTYRDMMQRYAAGGRAAPAGHRRRPGADAEAVEPVGVAGDARARRPRPPAGRVARARGGVRRARHRRRTCPTRPTG